MIDPLWRNVFENAKAVQFVHRMNAYLVFAVALVHMVLALRYLRPTPMPAAPSWLFGLVCLQRSSAFSRSLPGTAGSRAVSPSHGAYPARLCRRHWRGFHGAYQPETLVVERH